MIVGANKEDDFTIITKSDSLYKDFNLKRVFYSGFVPVVESKFTKGVEKVPLVREHRLYQADWLMRFYNFKADEIVSDKNPFLDLSIDPKTNWAINHLEFFPVEINRASYGELLRVPGFGKTYAYRIVKARRFANLTFDDLKLLKISIKKAINFITVGGKYRGVKFIDSNHLRMLMQEKPKYTQLTFGWD